MTEPTRHGLEALVDALVDLVLADETPTDGEPADAAMSVGDVRRIVAAGLAAAGYRRPTHPETDPDPMDDGDEPAAPPGLPPWLGSKPPQPR